MTPDECARVSINHAIRDQEIAIMETTVFAASPGAWAIGVSDGAHYVRRFVDRIPLTSLGDASLMALSREWIPRLLTGVRVLEVALRTAWAEAASWKAEAVRQREAHVADLARASTAQTGPEEEVGMLVRLRLRGVLSSDRALAGYLARWARGESLARELGLWDDRNARSDKTDADRLRQLRADMDTVGEWYRVALDTITRLREELAAKPARKPPPPRAGEPGRRRT